MDHTVTRHVRGAGLFSELAGLGHIRAMPDPVLDAGGVGAIVPVTGKAGGEDLAGHGGLAGGEVGELEDPGAVDGRYWA